jgi:predicted Ser/Thr protein kinase
MEYISGTPIIEYIGKAPKKSVIRIIKKIFGQLYALDCLLINKDEMSHPAKHILIRGTEPIMIDFERARHSHKTHNVTQFCQFIGSAQLSALLRKRGISFDRENLMQAAKAYSSDNSKENLGKY